MRTPTRHADQAARGGRSGQRGFALILAILSLLLLTFLGLTLAATTTTELQIATNQRWAQQARYNAEAGIEAARVVLREIAAADGDWSAVLHGPQAAAWPGDCAGATCPTSTPPPPLSPGPGADAFGIPARNWENQECAERTGKTGYGNVLARGGVGGLLFQNVTTLFGVNINGSVTVWVRRPLQYNSNGTINHDPSATRLILTAEGTAPFASLPGGDPTSAYRRRRQATRVMEVSLSMTSEDQRCDGWWQMAGQEGYSPDNPNFAQCVAIDAFQGNDDVGGQ